MVLAYLKALFWPSAVVIGESHEIPQRQGIGYSARIQIGTGLNPSQAVAECLLHSRVWS